MLKRNLFFLFSLTVVAIASVILCIFNYNPYQAQVYQFVIFYISIFLAMTGILTIIIFYAKMGLAKKEVIFSLFGPSFRQSLFVSAGLTALLVLKGMKLFDLWVGIPLLLILILLELFFQTKKRPV